MVCPNNHWAYVVTITNDYNHIISATYQGYVILWNFHDRVQEVELHDGSEGICDRFILAPTKDDKYLLKSTEISIVIWNLETKSREAILLSDHQVLLLNPDSILIINTDSSGFITAYICRRQEQVAFLRGHTTGFGFIPIQSDTSIVSASEDQNARNRSILLEIEEGLVGTEWVEHINELVTADKRYVIYAYGQYICKVNINDRTDQQVILYDYTEAIERIFISKDGNYVVYLSDKGDSMRLWSISENKLKCTLEGHAKRVTSAIITRDNKHIVSGSHDTTVRIWNIEKRIQETVLEGHTASVTCVAMILDDRYIISASDDYTLRIWSFEKKQDESILIIGTALSNIVVRDNKYIVSRLRNNTIRVWKFSKQSLENR